MPEESPAVPAVAANAGDSRPEAATPKPESTSIEASTDQKEEKAPDSEEQSAETSDEKKPDDRAPAEHGEVNGKGHGKTDPADAHATNGTPSAKSSSAKRKSIGGGSSSAKKLNKKKSSQRITHLDAQPGEYYLARLKSFPPWPSIICDEEMLPQSLLNSRPVTTKQADGKYKEPYADGGKRVYDRTFPIMFLETNEFAWIPNTDLTPLDPESCKEVTEKGKQKQLIAAYKVAAENHDLKYFKGLLLDHQRAVQQEVKEREAAAAEKAALKAEKEAAKEEKKKKRKSVAADTDIEMADADDGKKSKATKKRKKDAESDAEGEKPNKTPKPTPKLKLSTPKDPNASESQKTSKSKKRAKSSEEQVVEPTPEEPELDPAEAKEKRQKEILFIRHKLQKGFLSRDQAPKEEEMDKMASLFTSLEKHGEIEVSIIRQTKIQKVLKAIIKLPSIPKEEQYNFKKRAIDILSSWKNLLDSDLPTTDGDAIGKEAVTEINGIGKEEKDDSAKPEASGEKEEASEDAKESNEPIATKDEPMPDAEPEMKGKPEGESAPVTEPVDEKESVAATAEEKATESTPA